MQLSTRIQVLVTSPFASRALMMNDVADGVTVGVPLNVPFVARVTPFGNGSLTSLAIRYVTGAVSPV